MFSNTEQALEDLRSGKPLILVDDERDQAEGNLIALADTITPEMINLMIRFARGIIYLALTPEKIRALGLPMMVENSPQGAANTVSIEAARGVSTGISAADRAVTILAAVSDTCKPADLVQPGHVFPLRAREGGVLQRAGMTECAVDLARLAGHEPAAVMVKVLDERGEVADRSALLEFATAHQLRLYRVTDAIGYRMRHESFVQEVRRFDWSSDHGQFLVRVFQSTLDDSEHYALTLGEWGPDDDVLVRVHSECLTGDVFGSIRCDCGLQLSTALELIAQEGSGVILYLRQEGRGIGLVNKVRAYGLQDHGKDTVEANLALGLPEDMRDYGLGCQILHHLGLARIRLLTNNPRKIKGLSGFNLQIVSRVPLEPDPKAENMEYLRTKKEKLGHLLDKV